VTQANEPGMAGRITAAEEAAIQRGIASDPDAPETNNAGMAEFHPAHKMLPMILGDKAASQLLCGRGHPALPVTRVAVKVRYDQDVIDAFRAGGQVWQTRMNSALREWANQHGLLRC
jgi:uncharacterized protein (DUF4415 family)